ncbi:MAG TPA: hypothetical protein VKA66_15650, partial [Mycobacterium sp.]|nr:hypothetical protein [Mycobacterium sp.]
LEGQPNPPNHGVDLIAAMHRLEDLLDERTSLVHYQEKTRNDSAETEAAQRMLEKNNEQIAAARKQKRDAREALWGMRRAVGEQKGLEEEFVGTAENPEDESDG